VDWHKGDALRPETFEHLMPEVGGVVHTLGTLIEGGKYKKDLKEGNFIGIAGQFISSVFDESNPLENNTSKNSYDALNRDAGPFFIVRLSEFI
jgi:hypothetical protein